MAKVNYRIQSKITGPDGKPDFVKYGTSDNIEMTIQYHKFHLMHKTHPDPQLRIYASRHGHDCFEFIVDPVNAIVDPMVEMAIMKPEKETRKKKEKSG